MKDSLIQLSKEDLDNTSPISESTEVKNIPLPEETVQTNLLNISEIDSDNKQMASSVADAKFFTETISKLNVAISKSVQEDGKGLTVNEADIITTAVEHLKNLIGYKGPNKIMSLESFGGTMSRKRATQISIESLDTLVTEVIEVTKKSYINRYASTIECLNEIRKGKEIFNQRISTLRGNALEFFKSEKYKQENNGIPLPTASYMINVYNNKEATDGVMPGAAVVNGLTYFNKNMSSEYLNASLLNLKSILVSFKSETEYTVENALNYIEQIYNIYNNLFINDSKDYITTIKTQIFRLVKYPISDMCNEIHYVPYNHFIKRGIEDAWFSSGISKRREVTPNNIKLGCLSDSEFNSILDLVEQNNNYKNNIDETSFIIELMVECLNIIRDCVNKVQLSDQGLSYKIETALQHITDMSRDFIDISITIAKDELLINNSLLDYCQDSLNTHITKQTTT